MQHWMEDQQVDSRFLMAVLLDTGMAAENFSRLARCFQGRPSEELGRMARESRAQGACLGGIFALVTGESPRRQTPTPDGGTVQTRLKRAYARALHLLSAFEGKAKDPEYGPVFQRLAARQQDHCRQILEIIGGL